MLHTRCSQHMGFHKGFNVVNLNCLFLLACTACYTFSSCYSVTWDLNFMIMELFILSNQQKATQNTTISVLILNIVIYRLSALIEEQF